MSASMKRPNGTGLRRGDVKCSSGRTSFQKGANTRGARNRTPKTPKRRANAAKHRPAAQAERTEKTTTTCTPRDAEMVAGAVDQDIDGSQFNRKALHPPT